MIVPFVRLGPVLPKSSFLPIVARLPFERGVAIMSIKAINRVRVECVYRTTCSDCTFVAGFNVIAEDVEGGDCIERYVYVNPDYSMRDYAFTDSALANELAGETIRNGFVDSDDWAG